MVSRFVYLASLAVSLIAFPASGETVAALAEQVRAAEKGFAQAMADRDLAAFESFLADEAVFFGQRAMRGKAAVVAEWKRFFEGDSAPFSWQADIVEVLDSGKLALSSGPVFDPQGKRTATFNSIWRREPDGKWKVVFDKGTCLCETPKSN